MTEAERQAMNAVLDEFKPLTPANSAFCGALQSEVRFWVSHGQVLVANRHNSMQTIEHTAHISPLGIPHVERVVLDSARSANADTARFYRQVIAVALLHEAIHKLAGASHPSGVDQTGNYIDEPFRSLPVVGPNPCSLRGTQ
jgi:hypothetical protein